MMEHDTLSQSGEMLSRNLNIHFEKEYFQQFKVDNWDVFAVCSNKLIKLFPWNDSMKK